MRFKELIVNKQSVAVSLLQSEQLSKAIPITHFTMSLAETLRG